MDETLSSPEIQHAVNEAFDSEKFVSDPENHMFKAIDILIDTRLFVHVDMGPEISNQPVFRYSIEGINKGGKSEIKKAIDTYYHMISFLYGQNRLMPPVMELPHLITSLREPPALPVQQMVKNAFALTDNNYNYREACRYKVTDP
ncbi:MAG: hypothetical protein ABIC57_01060, partial [bacterium]